MKDEKRKILFVTTAFGKGGAEKQLFKLAKYFDGEGFSVLIISMLKLNMFEEELSESDIRFIPLKMDESKLNIFKYFSIVKSFAPDVVISFLYTANILARIGKYRMKYPLITSIRSGTFGSKARNVLCKLTTNADNFTVLNSFSVLQNMIKNGLVDKNKSLNIPNIIQLPNYSNDEKLQIRKALRNELKISGDTFVFLFVGHCRPEKDYETLFQAIAQLQGDFKLIMIGNLLGQMWPSQRIDELGLSTKIDLMGKRDDVDRFYLAADSLVLSSISEGLPNAIMEAMSLELAIVATKVGGVLDLVEDRSTGILCNAGDATDLSNSMQQMMRLTTKEREKMGENGRKKISGEFDKAVVCNKWHNLVLKLT
ncbi:glycosyltransferase [Mucilaginibacter sp. dw_454]|uniref:glycosyltransferase n=1 Tax=Mucilaginibacter sp. dw_454 TaxID=2720079 RepID=UPI001BD5B508|nr:glycosyltransferase [Mucilaginibacter sp. dw_454]